MLTEERIERLLGDLEAALALLTDAADAVESAGELAAVAKASALEEHEFTGKNAEAREREALLTCVENATVQEKEFSLRMRKLELERAKARAELTRCAIKLWIAAATEGRD